MPGLLLPFTSGPMSASFGVSAEGDGAAAPGERAGTAAGGDQAASATGSQGASTVAGADRTPTVGVTESLGSTED